MKKTRTDWLQQHAKAYPQWSAVIEILIEQSCFVVVPAGKGWKDGDVEEQDLLVLEPGVKGPPAAYRIQGDRIVCVNYPGSYEPSTYSEWIVSVMDLVVSIAEGNTWIEGILSQ